MHAAQKVGEAIINKIRPKPYGSKLRGNDVFNLALPLKREADNFMFVSLCRCRKIRCRVVVTRELKQPRRRRQQEPHKFAYLTMKNSIFARFARAFFIF